MAKLVKGSLLLLMLVGLIGRTTAQDRARSGLSPGKMTGRGAMGSQTNELGLSQIGQVAISVKDLDRATVFYRDTLGMQYLFTANGMAFFNCSGIRLMLARLDPTGVGHGSSIVYYRVDDIRLGYQSLSAKGVQFSEEPELAARTDKFNLWLACFKDSEGNDLCLMSEVPPE